jgi:hypothetical protein
MKFACVFLLLALAALVSAQQETKLIIDDFEVRQDLLAISYSEITSSDPPLEVQSFVLEDSTGEILGGERDMSISMTQAQDGTSALTSNIADGEWVNSVPVGGAGIIFLQYDGVDNTIGLDQNGLGGIDFTNNLGSEIFVTIRSDLPATYTMFFYSAAGGNPCSVDFDVDGGNVETDFVFEFDSDFSGACDFGNIGAVEVEADASERVDSVMTFFGVRGDIPVTQTPTPSPSPLTSSAPTPSPSSTRTPDVDVPSDCHCQCPAFTCELIFDPDDDENNAYYFDDDDDNVNAGNGSGSSSSDASAMKLTFTAGLVVVLAALL